MNNNKTLPKNPSCPQINRKLISPKDLINLVRENKVTYIGLQEIRYLNFTLADYLEGLKQPNKPLVVNIRDIVGNPYLSLEMLYHFLSHSSSVDYIVDKSVDTKFSLKHSGEDYLSNTFFIGEEMSAITDERIRNMRSFFRKSFKRAKIDHPKYLPLMDLEKKIASLQKKGKTVALVSGVFDVLHEGHIQLLEDASNSADVLIVLTNSDYSTIRQVKNKLGDRPIHSLEERFAVLSSLNYADFVTAFDSETILPMLENLSNIVFVKTEKDKDKLSIKHEMDLVSLHHGKNVIVPYSKTENGSDLSSSKIIKAIRQNPVESFKLSYDEPFSPLAVKKLIETVNFIKGSINYSRLLKIKRQLYKRHSYPRDKRAILEEKSVQWIISLSRDLAKEFGLSSEYYSFIIPYILGKLLHFDIKIVPIQNNDSQSYEVVNAVKIVDGRTIFFDISRALHSEPFVFENLYWKVMAHHSHYLLKNPHSSLAKRVFCYPAPLHYQALSLKILLEDYLRGIKNTKYKEEIIKLSGNIWGMLEESPYHQIPLQDKREGITPESAWPGIVAHGGSAVLSQKHPLRAENSLKGILHALKNGVDVVEVDVNACKDGWVVYHDQKLEIGTISQGTVAEMTEQELTKIKLVSKTGLKLPDRIITLSEALELIGSFRLGDSRGTFVKIDIKFTNQKLEKLFIDIIKKSKIPLEKTLITSELVPFNKRVPLLCPQLPFEFNTVESNLFLLSYGLMEDKLMLNLYTKYIETYAFQFNAKTVSLAQFATAIWGNELSRILIENLHQRGLQVQLWTATSLDDYVNATSLGADYVLMQDPNVIAEAVSLKHSHLNAANNDTDLARSITFENPII
jgi:cytidyltransferase-like protein